MKKSNPIRGLALLLALGLVVYLAAMAWQWLGRGGWKVTLQDVSGDAGTLRGFVVSGQVNNAYTAVDFVLRDGYLETKARPDGAKPPENLAWYSSFQDVPAPEERAALEAAASIQETAWGVDYESRADHFWQMQEIKLADGTTVRVKTGEYTRPDSLVTARKNPDGTTYDWNRSYRETSEGEMPEMPVRFGSVLETAGSQYLVIDEGNELWPAGVYKAEGGLTQAELNARSADGTLMGDPVLLCTTQFGTLQPVFCPQDGVQCYQCLPMTSQTMLLLYRNTQNQLLAVLLDQTGKLLDQKMLMQCRDGGEEAPVYISFLGRENQSEAAFVCQEGQQADGSSGRVTVAALRTDGVGFTAFQQVEGTRSDQRLENCFYAALNRAGDKIMLFSDRFEKLTSSAQGFADEVRYSDGAWVAVYDQGNVDPVYLGWLDSGEGRAVGRQMLLGGLSVLGVESYNNWSIGIEFPTLDCDKGVI